MNPGNTPEPPPSDIGLTKVSAMLASAGIGCLLGWALVTLVRITNTFLPTPPWGLVTILAAGGVVQMVAAASMRRRLAEPESRPSSDRAVLLLLVAKSTIVTGFVAAGGYLVYVLVQLDRLDVAANKQRAIGGLAALLASGLFAVGGIVLERSLRVPPEEDPDALAPNAPA